MILLESSVIIIDDNYELAEVVSEFFRLKSINVLATGKNGKEAVELYKEHTPDVVLMDFMMPDFDGLYGLENIRKINPNAKVIIMTGADDVPTQKLTELGVYSIIIKPCDMAELIKIINTASSSDTVELIN
ncbi:CheY-like receiver [Candidatus Nitrosarchaeum limnium SFB1]|jgi:DNA-binding NtrC family response regulator|uniref:CheY-like receiver n=1 Tax=Candidatus Nitrosarchaeum limnium SFB1 TaxID=886738 RepID=F3KJX4_9ARCH|nr:CheY-like receiver [Candidatus Nitrosarchaeum limnium SFB1]